MKNRDGLNWEVSVGVTFAAFMSAVSLFFTGMLIAQYKTFDTTIKIPMLFLIISTFSFIFSAAIYSNAGVEITNGNLKIVEKYLAYANNIFEFSGIYLFILATPLIIGSVTNDNFFRISTMIIALGGLLLYSQSPFSILHKEVANDKRKLGLSSLIIILALGMYFAQKVTQVYHWLGYSEVSSILLVVIGVVTWYFCRKSDQYK